MIDHAAIARASAALTEDDILAHASRSDLYAPIEGYADLLALLRQCVPWLREEADHHYNCDIYENPRGSIPCDCGYEKLLTDIRAAIAAKEEP